VKGETEKRENAFALCLSKKEEKRGGKTGQSGLTGGGKKRGRKALQEDTARDGKKREWSIEKEKRLATDKTLGGGRNCTPNPKRERERRFLP